MVELPIYVGSSKADRAGSWAMHTGAISNCLTKFAAAGHFNYLKSAYINVPARYDHVGNDKSSCRQPIEKGATCSTVVRRTDKYWEGLGFDMVIEQTLMRTLKSNGGLTRGNRIHGR